MLWQKVCCFRWLNEHIWFNWCSRRRRRIPTRRSGKDRDLLDPGHLTRHKDEIAHHWQKKCSIYFLWTINQVRSMTTIVLGLRCNVLQCHTVTKHLQWNHPKYFRLKQEIIGKVRSLSPLNLCQRKTEVTFWQFFTFFSSFHSQYHISTAISTNDYSYTSILFCELLSVDSLPHPSSIPYWSWFVAPPFAPNLLPNLISFRPSYHRGSLPQYRTIIDKYVRISI